MLKALKNARHDRIENCVVQGMPDVCLTYEGVTYWYELKIAEGAKGRMTIGPEQRNWHSKELKAGGKAFVLAYNRETKELYRFKMPESSNYIPENDRKLIKISVDIVQP